MNTNRKEIISNFIHGTFWKRRNDSTGAASPPLFGLPFSDDGVFITIFFRTHVLDFFFLSLSHCLLISVVQRMERFKDTKEDERKRQAGGKGKATVLVIIIIFKRMNGTRTYGEKERKGEGEMCAKKLLVRDL